MGKITGIIGAIAGLLGLLLIGYMWFGHFTGGFEGSGGMAILAFQLYGVIFAGLGMVLGLLGHFIGKSKESFRTGANKVAIWSSGLALLGMLVVFFAG